MHSFHYRDQRLFCEDVDVATAAAKFGTPLYLYSAGTILDHYGRLDEALAALDHLICYAVKANSNGAILHLLSTAGAGFDIVSGGELYRVIKAGGDPAKCTFAGVGKSREEIEFALKQRVYSFNVESEAELEYINEIARAAGHQAAIALRVNPDVAAETHSYISTGKSEDKFGVALSRAPEFYDKAAKMAHVRIRGVQMHIGSQITTAAPFVTAINRVADLIDELRSRHPLEFFSVGGGLGIAYQSSIASGRDDWWTANRSHPLTIAEYARAILPSLKKIGLRILLEPGRLLVGNAGVLLTRIRYLKRNAGKTFAIVDAGMNDLIRPALYGSYHEIVPAYKSGKTTETIDIVGPVCESGDFFAHEREMPTLQAGDLLAIMSAGAYGFVMASNYNSRPLPAEVLIRGNQLTLIRERQSFDDLIRGEVDIAM